MKCNYCYYLYVCPYGRQLVYNEYLMNLYERQQELNDQNMPPPTIVLPFSPAGFPVTPLPLPKPLPLPPTIPQPSSLPLATPTPSPTPSP